ncbi:glycosyltransferase family 29 protein [Rhizobium gallicum]|uniref:glycosyltransferase family 29 protein n=1 Tax=Rhizobium gallicum TaxID=56730 RepID=UPI0023BA4356|nr:glycosyltransferase family 29 protein [Rhizobium gallicum]
MHNCRTRRHTITCKSSSRCSSPSTATDGGASTVYNSNAFQNAEVDDRLDAFVRITKAERITKAPQNADHLNQLPEFDILAPLQVPGDDALVYHSDVSLERFIEELAKFAELSGVKVMFRQHPFDETDIFDRMRKKFASKAVVFSRAGHIHDCLSRAKVVAVINSGVGFEAMLFDKPVITFGRAIYDPAVFTADLKSIGKVYSAAISENPEDRRERYSKFISNYIYAVGFKLDEAVLNKNEDRSAVPAYSPNPIHEDFGFEKSLQTRGVKLTKPPAGAVMLRLKNEASVRLQRLQKLSGMGLNRFNKRVVAPAWGRAARLLTSPLSEEIFSGKTVALVGNASSLAAGIHGSEIDSHDIVIRMNLGYPLIVRKEMRGGDLPAEYLEGYFVDKKSSGQERLAVLREALAVDTLDRYSGIQALGKKTDIWSCSTSDKSRQLYFAPLFNCTTVACHPAFHHLSPRLLLTRRVKRFPAFVYRNLVKDYNIEPSSGLLWIDYLRHTGLVKLNIYGFDFFSSGHIARSMPNTLELRGKWPHAPDVEKEYVMKLLDADPRVRLVRTTNEGERRYEK